MIDEDEDPEQDDELERDAQLNDKAYDDDIDRETEPE